MNILGIDTSCDDTSAAIVKDGKEIRSLIVTSQDRFHEEHGGVVPEIASRKHLELITITIDDALKQAGLTLDDINGVAVTAQPGLIGSLVVGIAAAKVIAYTKKVPLTAVNHLLGHPYANCFSHELTYPHIALVVSGGHTLTALIQRDWKMKIIGYTRDDAAGECLDKVSKMLGLGYPGGKIIDELSKKGEATRYVFPRPMIHDPSPHFSFSGLKTAVRVFLEKSSAEKTDFFVPDLVASVQEAVMEVLVTKTLNLARKKSLKCITVSGGVASNSRLRTLFDEQAGRNEQICFPPPILCTDNAAIIAGLGYHQIKAGKTATLELNANARVSMS